MKTIAEIGINHNGSIEKAKKLIDIADSAGFDYVKFQKREISLCVPEHMRDEIRSTPWGEMSYYDYKNRIEFDFDDYAEISHYCKDKRIEFFASVWDVESARFMREFSDIVKIPSALITNIALLEICRELFDTVIISTGMSTEEQVFNAIVIADPAVIMHTHSAYPAPMNELNLEYIKWLKDKWPKKQIGYSGHEVNLLPSFLAVALGAEWIERHVTLDRNEWGSDQLASVEPSGMFQLISGLKDTVNCLGGYDRREIAESEKSKLKSLRPNLLMMRK